MRERVVKSEMGLLGQPAGAKSQKGIAGEPASLPGFYPEDTMPTCDDPLQGQKNSKFFRLARTHTLFPGSWAMVEPKQPWPMWTRMSEPGSQ